MSRSFLLYRNILGSYQKLKWKILQSLTGLDGLLWRKNTLFSNRFVSLEKLYAKLLLTGGPREKRRQLETLMQLKP